MQVEHQCPQCGGPVVLEETDRILSCSFCKTRLFIEPHGHFRYYLPPSDPFLEDILFIPYWRFRGIRFLVKTSRIEEGIIDKTFLASPVRGLAPTLGIRTQSLKLKFVKAMEKARFLRPQTAFDMSSVETGNSVTYEMITVHDTRLVRSGDKRGFIEIPDIRTELKEEKVYRETFIADTASVVYCPFHVRDGRVYDAIVNEPLPGVSGDDLLSVSESYLSSWSVNFLPTMCPDCGWDTVGEHDSLILFCRNCNTAWRLASKGMDRINFSTVQPNEVPEKDRLYLPFWRIMVNIEGIKLASYADLVRFGNLPKAMRPEWEESPLQFWVPAFKTTPSVFRRVAKQFTIANLPSTGSSLPASALYPVNLPLHDAVDSLIIIIADTAIRKKEVLPLLPEVKISVREAVLALVPFAGTDHEYILPEIRCGFMKNALQWGRNI